MRGSTEQYGFWNQCPWNSKLNKYSKYSRKHSFWKKTTWDKYFSLIFIQRFLFTKTWHRPYAWNLAHSGTANQLIVLRFWSMEFNEQNVLLIAFDYFAQEINR